MQERRTTIRAPLRSRARYCASGDFFLRDGYLTNLSERGIGLWVREPHQASERLTASFLLPRDQEPVTATGLVRWSDTHASTRGWYPLGVEWLPFEETARHRLRQFLSTSIRTSSPDPGSSGRPAIRWARVLGVGIGGGLLVGAVGTLWFLSISQPDAQLLQAIDARDTAIQELEEREARLREALRSVTTHLRVTSEEVGGLVQQTEALEGEAQQLQQDVAYAEEAHAALHEEREALMGRVLELEQARTARVQQSIPIKELQVAIREAIDRRASVAQPLSAAGRRGRPHGNQGYLVREGRAASR